MTPADERRIESAIKSFDEHWYIDANTSEVRRHSLKGWYIFLDLFWRKKNKVFDLYWWSQSKLDSVDMIHLENIIEHDDVPIKGFPRKYRMLNDWTIPPEDLKFLYEGPLVDSSRHQILVKHQSSFKKIISIASQLRPLSFLIPLIVFSYKYWREIEEIWGKIKNAI